MPIYDYSGQITLIGGIQYQGGPFSPQTAEANFPFNFPSGETFQSAQLFITISITPTLIQGAVATIILNGQFLGNINFDPLQLGGQFKIFNADVSNKLNINGDNKLSIKLDPFSNSMTFTVSATLYYTFTETIANPYNPSSPTIPQPYAPVTNPTTGNQAAGTPQASIWQKAKPFVILGVILIGAGLATYAIVGTKTGRGTTIKLISLARRKKS